MKSFLLKSILLSLWCSFTFASIVPEYCVVNANWEEFKDSEEWTDDAAKCISKEEMANNFVSYMKVCGLPIANFDKTPEPLLALKPTKYLFTDTTWDSPSLGYYWVSKLSGVRAVS
jgi:hypothetical protein